MEGMRQLDEFRALAPKMPPLNAKVLVPRPLMPKLRDLKPEELDIMQSALAGDTIQGLLDASRNTDLQAAQALMTLLERGYIVTG
jgi:hypothetical protein